MRRKSGVEKKMQITYQNEWEYTNIHVDLPIPYEEDYQIKMIHYNKIKGMLPVQGIGRDGQSRYTFRLENGMSMDKIYEEAEISGKEIEDFMEQLSVITEQIKIFFLNNNHIILDPKLIFKKAEQYYFCYLPIIKKENEPTMCEAFHELTEYFVKHLDYKDTEGSVKNFVALVKNGSFLVRITDMTILIEKEFIYGSSKRPNPTDYYRKQHYQCG